MIFEFTSIFIVIICWKEPLSDTNWWILIYHPVNSPPPPFHFRGQNCLELGKQGCRVFYINKRNCENCFLLQIALNLGIFFCVLVWFVFLILITNKPVKWISTHFRLSRATICAFKWSAWSFRDCATRGSMYPLSRPCNFGKIAFLSWVF